MLVHHRGDRALRGIELQPPHTGIEALENWVVEMLSRLEVARISDHGVVIRPVPDIESPAGEAILIDRGQVLRQETAYL